MNSLAVKVPAQNCNTYKTWHIKGLTVWSSLFRVSKKPPTVKMQVLTVGDFVYFRRISNRKAYFSELVKSPCCARHFDLLRKPPSTVPMYADECGLLVLAAPLTSASLSKNKFFDRLGGRAEARPLLFIHCFQCQFTG